jgi:antitoxin (DNA-binding transcriptional repressor) of toxin-antitoxin stability system
MSVKLKDMKTVTTREIQQHTRSVRERLEAGEMLQWMLRGRVVAHLKPATPHGAGSDWPDPLQRLRTIYGKGRDGGRASASKQIYQDRG